MGLGKKLRNAVENAVKNAVKNAEREFKAGVRTEENVDSKCGEVYQSNNWYLCDSKGEEFNSGSLADFLSEGDKKAFYRSEETNGKKCGDLLKNAGYLAENCSKDELSSSASAHPLTYVLTATGNKELASIQGSFSASTVVNLVGNKYGGFCDIYGKVELKAEGNDDKLYTSVANYMETNEIQGVVPCDFFTRDMSKNDKVELRLSDEKGAVLKEVEGQEQLSSATCKILLPELCGKGVNEDFEGFASSQADCELKFDDLGVYLCSYEDGAYHTTISEDLGEL